MKNAKLLVALLTAALTGVVDVLPVGSTATQWVNFALAVLGAVLVYVVPNAPAARSRDRV
jgi:hypothetical protein